jgi:hypothetical protein
MIVIDKIVQTTKIAAAETPPANRHSRNRYPGARLERIAAGSPTIPPHDVTLIDMTTV